MPLALITVIASILSGLGGYYLKHYLDKNKEMSSETYKERRDSYFKFVDIFVDILKSSKQNKEVDISSLTNKLYGLYKSYLLYASPKVIMAYGDYFQFLYNQNPNDSVENAMESLETLTCILAHMRMDFGLSNRGLGDHSRNLLRPLITGFDVLPRSKIGSLILAIRIHKLSFKLYKHY
jgi:hypothetical protein